MGFKDRMLQLINDERAAHGIAPVQPSSALEGVAEGGDFNGCGGFVIHGRARDMIERNYFNHQIKDCANEGFTHMLAAAGIVTSGAGENIAFAGALDDENVAADNLHGQLVSDAGHLANIRNPDFTHVGIGVFRSMPGVPWTGSPGQPPNVPANQPMTRVFMTAHVYAKNPTVNGTTTGGTFHAVPPSRILDTRAGVGAAGPLGPGATLNLQVSGRGGVPGAGASAVALNLTVTSPDASSFLVAFPTGQPQPPTSNLNFATGRTVANLVVVPLGAGGQVSIFNRFGTTQVIADVAGWFDADAPAGDATRFHPVDPARILDTRAGNGASAVPLGAGATLDLQVTGRGGVAAGQVTAALLNVAVTNPTAPSFLTVFPTGDPRPSTSNVNVGTGQTVANLVVAKVGAGGRASIFNAGGTTDVIADVAGWFDDGALPTGTRFHPVTPARILDTRFGVGAPAGRLGPAAPLPLQVTGQAGVPAAGVSAVVLNVTVTQPTAPGFLTVFTAGSAQPSASNVNFAAGQTVANLVVARPSATGQLSIVNAGGQTHVIADVVGWFDAG